MSDELIRTSANNPGSCCICGTPIYVGDKIYLGTNKGNTVAVHDDCAAFHPEEALKIFDSRRDVWINR